MLLGVDLGTSQVKVLHTTAEGKILGQATAGYPVSAPRQGWAETDPRLWWRAVAEAIRSLRHRDEIRALGIAGQMHGLVLASERGAPLRPALLWLDCRATAEAMEYRQLPAEILHALGNDPSPGMAGPMALWLSRHEPDTYRAARWLLQPKDWLRLLLTGEPATDPSDASGTLLYDLATDSWSRATLAALDLDPANLPSLRPSTGLAGHLLPGPAAELGLSPGIPVAIGAADTAASLLAADLPGNDWALLIIGSGAQWIAPGGAPAPRLNVFRDADSGLYRLAPVQNAGVTLDWVRRTLGMSWDELYAQAASQPDARPPVFMPYLSPERWDGEAGGGWTGMRLAHTRGDLARAALDGVAALLRDRLDDLRAADADPRNVLLAGGGSRHPAWRALLASALALPLHEAAAADLTVHGAALLAAAPL
ncbi:MAG TPA: FGGY family carbohydrate kinase [Streptosporangiaceae bacterium]|nr:FGGY family carbohydrate kinase [Streptosporangiaceae bacterium]